MEREDIIILDDGIELEELAGFPVCCKPLPSATK